MFAHHARSSGREQPRALRHGLWGTGVCVVDLLSWLGLSSEQTDADGAVRISRRLIVCASVCVYVRQGQKGGGGVVAEWGWIAGGRILALSLSHQGTRPTLPGPVTCQLRVLLPGVNVITSRLMPCVCVRLLLTVGSWNLSTRGLGPDGRVFERVVCGWPFAMLLCLGPAWSAVDMGGGCDEV
jgi:hypothetical protein